MKNKTLRLLLPIFLLFLFITSDVRADKPESTVKHPEWSRDACIYEVNIRQFSKEGNFKGIEKHLPELKKLGVNILWLMPINPIGEKNRKGTLGSYYSVKDYLSVNPEFGTLEDMKEFVQQAHKLGMFVIIDWVANHTSWDNELTRKHPEFYLKDSAGSFISPVADWTDVIDLNFENKDLWKYMIDALKFWIKETNIDGYRCDVAAMVPIEFWNEVRVELDKIKPVFMLAEAEGPEYHNAFDMTYAWNFHHLLNDIAKEDKKAVDLIKYFSDDKQNYSEDAYRMLFITNHDENSWNGTEFERLRDGVKVFASLTFTAPGMPLIYSGQEIGLNKRLSFFETDPIEWKESEYRAFYDKLLKLKEKNKALRNGAAGGEIKIISSAGNDNIFSFTREKDKDKVFVVLNLSKEKQVLTLDDQNIKGKYKELFTKEKKTFDSKAEFNLAPWDYKIYVQD